MTTQAVVTAALLLCGVAAAQTPALQKADEKTLETVYAARSQAHDWVCEFWGELLRKGIDGDSKAGELANRIDDDRKRQHKWEFPRGLFPILHCSREKASALKWATASWP